MLCAHHFRHSSTAHALCMPTHPPFFCLHRVATPLSLLHQPCDLSADGGLVPRWAVPSTSPPPPKPSGSVTPPVGVVAAAIAVALTSLLFV
ncbi:unnamed protein product [Closterium sp. NIES-65]|nr:unnamed protein product [Closterium sp. NIES-65]